MPASGTSRTVERSLATDEVETGIEGGGRASLRLRFESLFIPLPFLGYGLLRGWLSVHCEVSYGAGTGLSANIPQDVFDLVMAATYLVCALFSSRLTPLHATRWARSVAAALLVGASLLWYIMLLVPVPLAPLALLHALMAGVGCTLLSLLWLELYAALSPVRICLYYAASLLVAAGIGWLYQGFKVEWLPVAAALLPLGSLRCLRNCYLRDELENVDEGRRWARFSFPWMPVLVIAAFAFSYGMLYVSSALVERQVTSAGTVLCAACIVALVALARNRFGFGGIYSVLLPLSAALSLTIASAGILGPWWSNFLANWGHVTGMVLIVVIMGTLCYHWGMSAVWLFGIENAVWSVATVGGRLFESGLASCEVSPALPTALVTCAAALVILRQRRTSSAWGVIMAASQTDPDASQTVRNQGSLTAACALLAAERNLSQREEEVLLLLAQHKTARDIERELCVANGTAKAHIRHVYQKLNIHTREELFAQVESARTRTLGKRRR